MAQMPGLNGPSPSAKPDNDIYTVLVCVAFVVVAGTLGFAIYRCLDLFGSPFPGIAG